MSSLLNKNVIENKRKLISPGEKALQDVLVKQKRGKNAENAVFYWSKTWRLCILQQGAFYLIFIWKFYVYLYTLFYMRICLKSILCPHSVEEREWGAPCNML